ncbi:hypothetical protein J4208_00775 [Candidatus Woesearchaeota archaeon]|nr:hypothetical protein [Candidatus Woesearchaeota archaeon]
MNVESMKKILENCTEETIVFDEPHVLVRCGENDITKEKVLHILLHETNTLTNIIEARPQVYRVYFQLTKKRQLKVILDLCEYKKIRIRTVKMMNRKLYKSAKLSWRRRW